MILYHGSNVVVEDPQIITSEIGRDFGPAFYLTPIKEQAEKMAKRKAKLTFSDTAYVSVFEWDENKEDLNYKSFKEADLEWLDFIIACRSNPKYRHEFDVVEGKIADDTVGQTILYVVEGVMRKEDALGRLKYQKINSQIAFCSEKALRRIKYINSYKVE